MIRRLMLLIALLFPTSLFAQNSDLPPPHFLYLRGGTESSMFAFYTYDFRTPWVIGGSPLIVLGTIADPRGSGYREYIVGGGLNVAGQHGGIIPFLVASKATDSWYFEVLAFPWLNKNGLSASAFLGTYLPIQKQGVRQFLVDPATVVYYLTPKVAFGGSYTLTGGTGLLLKQAVGPALQFAVPLGTVTFDLFKGLTNYSDEVRMTFQLAF